jgi:hypothetical protein
MSKQKQSPGAGGAGVGNILEHSVPNKCSPIPPERLAAPPLLAARAGMMAGSHTFVLHANDPDGKWWTMLLGDGRRLQLTRQTLLSRPRFLVAYMNVFTSLPGWQEPSAWRREVEIASGGRLRPRKKTRAGALVRRAP